MVGIAGGTCAGKTTLAGNLGALLPEYALAAIQFDAYYLPLDHLDLHQRARINFDRLESLDRALFAEHLGLLRAGLPAPVPVYDFSAHLRLPRVEMLHPGDVVIVEGILLLAAPELVEQLDLKVFVDVEPDVRLGRRVLRDMAERGRSAESVIAQYLESVRPMHELLVEPSRRSADLVVREGGLNPEAVAAVAGAIRNELSRRRKKR